MLTLREPGGTPFGEKLRRAVLETSTSLHPAAEVYLFLSSRAQLLFEVTLKELEVPGTVVIYDRFLDSTLAYQGEGRGIGFEAILGFHQLFPLTLVPHATFYLEISPEESLARQKKALASRDYFERQGSDFYGRLVEGYKKVCKVFPERIKVIDGGLSEEEVFEKVSSFAHEVLIKKEWS